MESTVLQLPTGFHGKSQSLLMRLVAVGLIVDHAKINKMTIPQLNDQISIYKTLLNNEFLLKVPQKDIKSKFFKLSAVLAVITRNEEYVLHILPLCV
jgi:hypothetical protein